MEFTSQWTSTLMLAMTMRFSPHAEERKLTLVQINRRWRKRGMVSSVGKAVRRSYLFRSVQCTLVAGSKSFLLLVYELFCRWIEKLFLSLIATALWVVLFLCEFKIISAWVSVTDHFPLSYRRCFVAVPVFTTSFVATFPWLPFF